MRTTTKLMLLFALNTLVWAPGAAPAAAQAERTLRGEYTSGYGDGPLEAVFTAAGEGRWKVAIHFNHSGRDLTYAGNAEGSLGEGELRGRVETPGGSRTFIFRGEFVNGRFRGTHAEIYRGREHKTGTLTLED